MIFTHDLLEETTGWLKWVCIDDKGKKKTSIDCTKVCGSPETASFINKYEQN